jgi:signal transduction histidine kinase
LRSETEFQPDIDAIESIAAVPTILAVVCKVTGMGYAAVARVTPNRWVCLASNDEIGFNLGPGGELKVDTTICHEVRQAHSEIVIDHVAEDAAYCNHHTPAMYGFQSYISVPITLKDGSFYGTLCAIDPKPANLKSFAVLGMFRLFAGLIADQLDAARRVVHAEEKLLSAQETADLREQFIAVLGHDLRNPVAAVAAGIHLLQRAPLDDKSKSLIAMMKTSISRMSVLIDDVMDLAKGRMGGGIALRRAIDPIEPALRHVVEEMRTTHPDRAIDFECNIAHPVIADHEKIARVLSNLLSNAIIYGAPDAPVSVRAVANGQFELSVTNKGPDIPVDAMKRLFAPYTRGETAYDQKGLGLGLYIVSEIARAHGGNVDATSAGGETRFTFRMPLDA